MIPKILDLAGYKLKYCYIDRAFKYLYSMPIKILCSDRFKQSEPIELHDKDEWEGAQDWITIGKSRMSQSDRDDFNKILRTLKDYEWVKGEAFTVYGTYVMLCDSLNRNMLMYDPLADFEDIMHEHLKVHPHVQHDDVMVQEHCIAMFVKVWINFDFIYNYIADTMDE